MLALDDMTDIITLYCTFPNAESAEQVSRSLVEARLVACANIMPGQGTSIYWWEDKIQTEGEIYVLYKTRAANFDAVRDQVISLHPYENPCIIALPIEAASDAYADWVRQETI